MSQFSDEDAEKEFSKRQNKFKKEDAEKIFKKEESLFEKFLNISNLKEYFEDFKDLYSLLKDFYKGNYTEVPWLVIASIGGSLLYVLSPIDLIPDFIPIIGYLDDAAVFVACLKFVGKDLEKYREWKESQAGEDREKKRLGVLGMEASGKTRFLSYLRNIPFIDKTTSKEKYDPFDHDYDGKIIQIDAGLDIGGGSLYRKEYSRILKKSDFIFYFLNIKKYLDDSPYEGVGYRRACNNRIEHVYSGEKDINSEIVIVGTHIDLCGKNETKVNSEFLNLNEHKSYYPVLKNIEFVDFTKTDQLVNFVKKVFK